MAYQLIPSSMISSNNQILILSILIGLVFFLFILPNIENYNNTDNIRIKEKFNDIVKIDELPCSSSCCKYTTWPVPFNTVNPSITKDELDKYIGSNLTCGTGKCVCLTKDNFDYLANHGH